MIYTYSLQLIDVCVFCILLDFPNSTEESYRDAKMKKPLSIGTGQDRTAVIIYSLACMGKVV